MGHITLLGNRSFTVWDESRPWLPHKCIFTGKWIMPFTKASRNRMLGYDGKPGMIFYLEYCVYWTRPEELIMQKLKGNV